MSPTPHTSLRWRIVMPATMAAILAVVWCYPDSPASALPLIGAVLLVSNVALPSLMWLRVMRFCRWSARMTRPCRTPPEPPESPADTLLRRRYCLDLAEYDARVQIGMPLGHLERLAYNLPNPEEWDEREAELWPDGWVHVIEEHHREQGWAQ